MAMVSVEVLAHQGGWDEALLIAGPIVLVGWLLWIAKRRIRRAALDQHADDAATDRSAPD